MSYELVWVQAHDGKFYCQPEIVHDDWYLRFDDVDPPFLILHEDYASRAEAMDKAGRVLQGLGIVHTDLVPARPGLGKPGKRLCRVRKRVLLKDFVGWALYFEFANETNLIPVPTHYHWVRDKPPAGSLFYGIPPG